MCDVDEHVEDSQSRDKATTDDQDATNVADDVGVLLSRPGSQQTLAARSTGPRSLGGPTAVANARSAGLCGALLSDDLRLEFSGSGFLGVRQGPGRTGCEACLGSNWGVSVGTPLARTVGSTGALGHVR